MEVVVSVNTTEDHKAGRKLFSTAHFADDLLKKGGDEAVLLGAGILENGTVEGNASLMFVVQDQSGAYHYVQMTSKIFHAIGAVLCGAEDRFARNKDIGLS